MMRVIIIGCSGAIAMNLTVRKKKLKIKTTAMKK